MKDKITFFEKLKISMFSLKKYPMLVKSTLASVLVYILVLSIIVGGIIGISQFAIFNLMEKGSTEILQDQKHNFTLKDGVLEFENSPYKIEESNALIIINTNKLLADKEEFRSSTVHKDLSTVFLKDGLIVRNYSDQYEVKYSDIFFLPKFADNSSVLEFIKTISSFKYVLLIINILITYIRLLIYSLIISLVALVLSKVQNIRIGYKDIFKISLFSMTLPTIFQLIIPLGFLGIMIPLLYVIFSLNYFREISNK